MKLKRKLVSCFCYKHVVHKNMVGATRSKAFGSLVVDYKNNSAHADGGPRSPSAHASPFARLPISMSGNFPAHMSAESTLNISPKPSEVIPKVSEH